MPFMHRVFPQNLLLGRCLAKADVVLTLQQRVWSILRAHLEVIRKEPEKSENLRMSRAESIRC